MRTTGFIAIATLLLAMWPDPAPASEQDQARELTRAGAIVPLEHITTQVRKHYGGNILEVELESEDGSYRYEVEVVDEAGVVRKLLYDATTGTSLGEADEN